MAASLRRRTKPRLRSPRAAADPERGLKPEDPLLVRSQTRRAPLFRKGVLHFKSQHLSKSRGGGGSPTTRAQSRDMGTLRRAPHKCPDPWKGCDGRRRGGPEAHLPPEKRGGAPSPGTMAGPSCAPRGTRPCRPRRLLPPSPSAPARGEMSVFV